MTNFLKISTYAINDARNPEKALTSLARDVYSVYKSDEFLVKSKVDEFDYVEEAFMFNLLTRDFPLYAYMCGTDWVSECMLNVLPNTTKHNSSIEHYPLALHVVTTAPNDDDSQQSMTTLFEVEQHDQRFLIVATFHSKLRLSIEGRNIVVNPDNYDYLDRMVQTNLPFLRDLEQLSSKTFAYEVIDENSREIQYKLIENIIMYYGSNNAPQIYQAVKEVFPNTVISDIVSNDEAHNLQAYGYYIVTEDDLEEMHEDINEDDIIIAMKGEEFTDVESIPEDELLQRGVGLRVYDTSARRSSTFLDINHMYFTNRLCNTTDEKIVREMFAGKTTAALGQHIENGVLAFADLAIDTTKLPEWKIFLLIPYIRIQMFNGIDIYDPKLDLLQGFLDYVKSQSYVKL